MKKTLLLAAFSLFIQKMNAQCSCPNVGPELVTNGDFSQGSAGFTTIYTNAQSAWPGNYGITTDAGTNNPGSWSNCHDHTTGSGNFMWVDADMNSVGLSMWGETFAVMPNTNYVFSFWFENVNNDSIANPPGTVQFSINGQLLGPLMTAPNLSCQWVQNCIVWNSGSNATASISIINMAAYFNGNDFGFDDISFRECINCNISPTISPATFICTGANVSLSASGGNTYSWTPAAGLSNNTIANPVASPTTTTTYFVIVSNGNCSSTVLTTVTVNPLPVAAGPDQTICPGQTTQLQVTGGVTYNWIPSTGLSGNTIPNPIAAPPATTTYTVVVSNGMCTTSTSITVNVVTSATAIIIASAISGEAPLTVYFSNNSMNAATSLFSMNNPSFTSPTDFSYTFDTTGIYTVWLYVTNANGCPDSTFLTIEVKPVSTLYVPNVFTPNANGINDVFAAVGTNITDFNLLVFDRWGNKIFESDDMKKGWDGKVQRGGTDMSGQSDQAVQEDVYVWKIKATGVDYKKYNMVGQVSVVR